LLLRARHALRHPRVVPLSGRGEAPGQRRAPRRPRLLHGQGQLVRRALPGRRHPRADRLSELHCPDKPFMSEELRRLWGDRTLPRHSLGEAYLAGKWLKLDATIDAATAEAKGRPYTRQFDGEHDIPTVEGPILADLESHADYP